MQKAGERVEIQEPAVSGARTRIDADEDQRHARHRPSCAHSGNCTANIKVGHHFVESLSGGCANEPVLLRIDAAQIAHIVKCF